MPLRLDIQRRLSNRSERVKAVDFHPTEPWLLSALYNGNVYLWNLETQQVVKTFEAADVPIRAAKFIARKSWLITGSDDLQVKVFNYNTHEKVVSFEAHIDYIRGIAVHHSLPLVLTCSDDMTIKLWDWEKNWKNVMTFEGHTHFVMHVAFNPKDSNTFASASMDRTLKVWNLSSPTANYTLEGHQKGINCLEYYEGGDKPYLVSGADDKLIKVWDYQNKTCVQTLEGHTNNVMRVCYHPSLPIIISGSEDGTIRLWHANTYRLENTLNYGMERVWCLAYLKGTNDVAFGYDEGTISIKLGRDEPSLSMDSQGKIVWAKHNEIQSANIQQVDGPLVDGEKILLGIKDLGSCEVYPQTLVHSPNGRFVTVCGDGEYIIYTALAWRNKSFGQALDFVWAQDSSEYAIRESSSRIKLFKSFKELNVQIRNNFSADAIFGGALLGVKSSGFLIFYDWETGALIRRVDVAATNVYWSENDTVAIACQDSLYILKFNRTQFNIHLENQTETTDEGYEDVMDFVVEISESVVTGSWAGDCFIYTNSLNRLCYLVGEQSSTVSHFDKPMFLLGYIPKYDRAFLCDKHLAVTSFSVPLSVIEYQTAVLRGDLEGSNLILPRIPAEHRNRIARFLGAQGLKEKALDITTDLEHQFELSLSLLKLPTAYDIASELDHEHKWKLLGDTALSNWNYRLAVDCFKKAADLQSVFLIYQASGNVEEIGNLASLAKSKGELNLALMCYYLLARHEEVVDVLLDTSRVPEAAFYSRTFAPAQIPRVVSVWKNQLIKAGKPKVAERIADPIKFEDLFEDHALTLDVEKVFAGIKAQGFPAALAISAYEKFDDVDVLKEIKNGGNIAEVFGPLVAGASSSPAPPPQKSIHTPEPMVAHTNGKDSSVNIVDECAIPAQPVSQKPSKNSSPAKSVPSSPKKTAKPSPDRVIEPTPAVDRVKTPVSEPEVFEMAQESQPLFSPSRPSAPKSEKREVSPDIANRKPGPFPKRGNEKTRPTVGTNNGVSGNASTSGSLGSAAASTAEELQSDSQSYMSMEVNTTGTGSVLGMNGDFDDFDIGEVEVGDAMDDEELERMLM